MSERRKLDLGKSAFIVGVSLIILSIVLGTWEILFFRSANRNFQPDPAANSPTAMSKEELDTEKLRQEVRQLQIENNRLASPWQNLPTYATLITAIVAVAGVFLTIWKQFSERQGDREQREHESRRQLDEKFSSIVADMGSENPSLRSSAIVSLMTFLRPEYSEFHEQVYLILLANLKLDTSLQVNRLLVRAFEKALPLYLAAPHDPAHPLDLDFTHANLYHANLSGLDLSNVDLGFANLRSVNLIDTNLFRAKGIEANLEKARLTRAKLGEARLAKANLASAHLHGADLVAATLKDTNLNGAEFFQARLQSAHLEGATIEEAHFEQAEIQDAYFTGARLNLATMKSLGKAHRWEDAHLDEDVRAKVAEFVRKSDRQAVPSGSPGK